MRGATWKLERVITAVVMSNLPMDTAHCIAPTMDWYCWMPVLSSNLEVSILGWSPFSRGEVYTSLGLVQKRRS